VTTPFLSFRRKRRRRNSRPPPSPLSKRGREKSTLPSFPSNISGNKKKGRRQAGPACFFVLIRERERGGRWGRRVCNRRRKGERRRARPFSEKGGRGRKGKKGKIADVNFSLAYVHYRKGRGGGEKEVGH